MSEENKTTTVKVKKEKKPLSKAAKGWIIFASIMLALIIVITGVNLYAQRTDNKESDLLNSVLVALIPKEVSIYDNGNKVTFYIEKNKKYDEKKDQPLDAFTVYYYQKDSNGKKKRVDLVQGHYKTPTEENYVEIGFILAAKQRLNKMVSVLNVVRWIILALIIVSGIYLWFRNWNKRQDKKEALEKEMREKDLLRSKNSSDEDDEKEKNKKQ